MGWLRESSSTISEALGHRKWLLLSFGFGLSATGSAVIGWLLGLFQLTAPSVVFQVILFLLGVLLMAFAAVLAYANEHRLRSLPLLPPQPSTLHRSRHDLDRLSEACSELLTVVDQLKRGVGNKLNLFKIHWEARFLGSYSPQPEAGTVESGIAQLKEIVDGTNNLAAPLSAVLGSHPAYRQELERMLGINANDYLATANVVRVNAFYLCKHLELIQIVDLMVPTDGVDRQAGLKAWTLARYFLEELRTADEPFQEWFRVQEHRINSFRNNLDASD